MSLLARSAALYVFKNAPLDDLMSLYRQVCPLIKTPSFNSHIAAPSLPVDNPVYNEYITQWDLYTLRGVEKWMLMFHLLRKKCGAQKIANSLWKEFFSYIYDILPAYVQLEEWMIPLVLPIQRGEEFGDTAQFRQVSITEYIRYYNVTPIDFIVHIIEIVLFGLVIGEPVVHALRLDEVVTPYIQARLQNGDFHSYSLAA